MKVNENESYKIQLLRGLAIILVVLIHNTPDGITQVYVRPFFNIAVGIFLFLSGILSNAKNYNPKKRILKLIIPYIIWTLIYVLLSNFKNPSKIPMLYLKNLLTAKSSSVMYYVFVYIELTLLIPIIDKLAKSKYKYLGFIITPIEIILFRLLPEMGIYHINSYLSIIVRISCLGWFTFYYLGYLLGNNLLKVKYSNKKLTILLIISIIIQGLEGYWYFSNGIVNCGTQSKLSSILETSIFCLLAFNFIKSKKEYKSKILYLIGNYSFGIFYAHLAVMKVLNYIPYYSRIIFPINALITLVVTILCIYIGKKILGKYSKYLAL